MGTRRPTAATHLGSDPKCGDGALSPVTQDLVGFIDPLEMLFRQPWCHTVKDKTFTVSGFGAVWEGVWGSGCEVSAYVLQGCEPIPFKG